MIEVCRQEQRDAQRAQQQTRCLVLRQCDVLHHYDVLDVATLDVETVCWQLAAA